MTKKQPTILPVTTMSHHNNNNNKSSKKKNIVNNQPGVKTEILNNVDEIIDNMNTLKMEQAVEIKDLDIDEALKKIKKENIGVEGARIEGSYHDYMNLLIKKHESDSKELKGEIIMLNSCDGTEHYNSN